MITRRVYIAGPISGHDLDERRSTFAAAADMLRVRGFEPVNPFDVAQTLPGRTWADYMRIDLAALLTCDAIHLLDGWQQSRGALIEATLAHDLGMEVIA